MQQLLFTKPAAQHLTERGHKIAPSTLDKLASLGGGPPFRYWGNRRIYDPADLDRWAEQRLSARHVTTSILEADAHA